MCADMPLNIAIPPALESTIAISVNSDIFDLNADIHQLRSFARNLPYTES